jgi:hypothetical protein
MRVAKPHAARFTPDAFVPSRRRTAVGEDRKERPFEGGSQPVPHQKDPVPGPGRTAGQVITLVVGVLTVAVILFYIFGR